ncbi:5856_t:CDS:1, partial [Dentiscutata erythropus]
MDHDNIDSNSNYIISQLNEYMLRLSNTPTATNIIEKPNSNDPTEWGMYIEYVKESTEEKIRTSEYERVESLIEHTYRIIQDSDNIIFTNDKTKKKWIKDQLSCSISNDYANSTKNRYKQ